MLTWFGGKKKHRRKDLCILSFVCFVVGVLAAISCVCDPSSEENLVTELSVEPMDRLNRTFQSVRTDTTDWRYDTVLYTFRMQQPIKNAIFAPW